MLFLPFFGGNRRGRGLNDICIYTHIFKIFMCSIEVGAWSCTCRRFEGGSIGTFNFDLWGGGV